MEEGQAMAATRIANAEAALQAATQVAEANELL